MLRYIPLILFALLGAPRASGQSQLQDPEPTHSLSRFVRLSFDHRLRFEDYRNLHYRAGDHDHWLLNRIRINLSVLPASWLAFHAQAQDSRIFFKLNPSGTSPFINRTDLRLGYADIRFSRFLLRLGRQELAYGEDRLIGAANWGNVARSFDAIKLIYSQGPLKLDLFSASVVRVEQRGLSRHQPGNNIHGAYLQWKGPLHGATLEPYIYWRIGNSSRGYQNRRILGFRMLGPLPHRFDYSTEFVQQYGSFTTQTVRAFATHLQLRYTFARGKWVPRAIFEYNYASGDANPNDGIARTFDQIYPTPHNKTGLADQVGWVNIHNLAATFELTPHPSFVFRAGFHDWRLATPRDGLFQVNGALIHRDPTGRSGAHVGNEIDALATYTRGPHAFSLGYGHILAGRFLRSFTPGHHLNYIFVSVGYRF